MICSRSSTFSISIIMGGRDQIVYYIVMGSVCGAASTVVGESYRDNEKRPGSFVVVDLPSLNDYPQEATSIYAVQKVFRSDNAFRLYGSIVAKLIKDKRLFEDPKFEISNSVRPFEIYNSKSVPKMLESSGSEKLEQGNSEFTYLSAVFSYIADNPRLLQELMLTHQNDAAFYVTKLFPNGDHLMVVTDDRVPFREERLLYSKSTQFQLWLYILEKAWVKLVGGYEEASGLSPEDAFEEIIGAPAYSYFIAEKEQVFMEQLYRLIKSTKQQKMCIIMTSRQAEYMGGNLLGRQVFYLDSFVSKAGFQFVKLRSAYNNFTFRGQLNEKSRLTRELDDLVDYSESHPGTIFLSPKQVAELFDYCTIGFYKQGYQTTSHLFRSQFNQPKYFKITIRNRDNINMRIVQLYEGYVRYNQNYAYSSVYVQLFDMRSMKIIAEGCRRAIYGTKSTNVFQELFENIEMGEYLLKVDIEWKFHEKINDARLVVYSLNDVKIVEVAKEQGNKLHNEMIRNAFELNEIKEIDGLKYGSKWLTNSVYLYYNNQSGKQQKLSVHLNHCRNLIPTTGKFIGKTIEVDLEPQKTKLIELRKEEVGQPGTLGQYMIEMR